MLVPSQIDLATARKIVDSPNYTATSIVVLITTYERTNGFQSTMYYISAEEPYFQPVEWHEVNFAIGHDIGFVKPTRALFNKPSYARFSAGPQSSSLESDDWNSSYSNAKNKYVPSIKALCNVINKHLNPAEEVKPALNREEFPIAGFKEHSAPPWHMTEQGRQRLMRETRLLTSFSIKPNFFAFPDKTLGLSVPRGRGRSISVITGLDYPNVPPNVFLHYNKTRPPVALNGFDWSPDSHLVDVMVPLLGPDMDIYARS